jgi:hypothetical protein
MLLVLSGAVLITPLGLTGVFIPASILFGALAVLAFLLPLLGLHRRLAEAKENALSENAHRWRACTAQLHRMVDRGRLGPADRLDKTLSALERARAALEHIPTWPWRPETFRGLIAALVLPVAIWLIQFGLGRLLG